MLIFWKQKLVLLAVPKTGSTALEAELAPVADVAVVNPPGLKHCSVRKYRNRLAPFFERDGQRPMELVAVMREPIDWLASWFRYRARTALDGQANSTARVDFDAFVAAYLSDAPPDYARVGSQAKFLEGGVDHLFRYDRFPDLVAFLETRLDRKIELSEKNVSPARDALLSDALHDRLLHERRRDFDLWCSLCNG
ncbi:hypothetical protein JSE7799_00886 [Jannaschia seosinensis]|uniref:Gamma-glutamyl kinase n=1 Tax=Jannaschia seosinensis TaxID=313367 RepID=A0A0M7B757_9RHOB|nr:hypothetical protein [Jannaschia seosinensis]CUH30790.1 hypothetical protein JSE7799_00886 [Jannaschia seosinensis]